MQLLFYYILKRFALLAKPTDDSLSHASPVYLGAHKHRPLRHIPLALHSLGHLLIAHTL